MSIYNVGRKNPNFRHGMTRTPEHTAWLLMKNRCSNSNHPNYQYYGGRGIRVCSRWFESFENFYEDMGRRPSGNYSLDRINNDGDYEPNNCRWATRAEQQTNKRININNRTGFRGVSWANHAKKYVAHIHRKDTKLHLGVFKNPEQAALAYDCAAIQLGSGKLNILRSL